MAEKNWNIKNIDIEKAKKLADELNTTVEFAVLLINRGIEDKNSADMFLNCRLSQLHDPFLMKGIREAVDIIKDSVLQGEKIGIFGDYDVDGVTSTVIMCEALRCLNADFAYYLPHRVEEGYGLSPEGIAWAVKNNIKLAITVDNGITNINEVSELKSKSIAVIITDHHEVPHANVGQNIPSADVIINPKQHDCHYPNKDLSGVGVAFKLAQALFIDKPFIWQKWLYLAALGTLADCMDLSAENRILVKEGIKQINQAPAVGIKALLKVAAYKNNVDSQTIGFVIAPRINAAGRLDKAEYACELLLAQDEDKASKLASKLNDLNIKRQKVELQIQKDVEKMLLDDPGIIDKNILFLFNKEWHIGVLGITASKLSDKFAKPVFLMSSKSGYIKGSARAPENYNVFEMLSCAQEKLLHFGGHKGAGGFSLREENKDEVFEILNKCAEKYGQAKETIDIDMVIDLSKINIDFVKKISELEPFGRNNLEPAFLIRNSHIHDANLVGTPPIHLRMNIKQDNFVHKVIGFRKSHLYQHIYPDNFFYDIVFNLGIDNYMGIEKVNLICVDIKKPDDFAKSVVRGSTALHGRLNGDNPDKIVDCRNIKDKNKYLENIIAYRSKIMVVFEDEKEALVGAKNFPKAVFAGDTISAEDKTAVFVSYSMLPKIPKDIIFEDIILYDIPHSRGDFLKAAGLLKFQSRLHVLFGYKEVIKKKHDIKKKFLSRQKLSKIYNIICHFKKQDKEINKDSLAGVFNKHNITFTDFTSALDVFEELGICRIKNKNKAEFEIENNVKNNLENSLTYRGIVEKNKELEKFINLFEEINLKRLHDKMKKLMPEAV